MMTRCWQTDPDRRPSFDALSAELNKMVSSKKVRLIKLIYGKFVIVINSFVFVEFHILPRILSIHSIRRSD